MIRMAQYGTKHGHASGKLKSMLDNPDVEVAGLYEPDTERRREIASDSVYGQVHFFDSEEEMLGDDSIAAIASEGRNDESLDQTERIVAAGKHVWYDKPAGDNWVQWQKVVAEAKEQDLQVQMGFMLRYHPGFSQISEWARAGFLGNVYAIRAHMSTHIKPEARAVIAAGHYGGIYFDLAGHMLDQVVWILGRPERVTTFLRNDAGVVPDFQDNTLGVFEYERALAMVDIAAMEPQPMARRFEVYGEKGSAILVEPFEPGHAIRLCLTEAAGGYEKGEQMVEFAGIGRQGLYDLELASLLRVIQGQQEPDRSLDHELLVQETLLRGNGSIAD
ncbi:Gfo/Idh/MocA family oxidoreductase [bacterium]|nr:Gfo/Idh/MocA family oxidoreductase [bacterium]|tara:strand:- start:218 stop:1213 length:996 start_codon:yes stop_codon:yes gene_type:complete